MKNKVSLSLTALAAFAWLSVAAFYNPVASPMPHSSAGHYSTSFAGDPTIPPYPPPPPPDPRSGQTQQA